MVVDDGKSRGQLTLRVGGSILAISLVFGSCAACGWLDPPKPPEGPPVPPPTATATVPPPPASSSPVEPPEPPLVKCDWVRPRALERGVQRPPVPRIVGGTRCWREYQLSLGYAQGSAHVHFCGAVLVEPRVAYTAAHCKPQVGDQVSGGHQEYAKGDKVRVADVLVHDEYGWPVQHNNDVAVLLLDRQPAGSVPIDVARTDPRPEVSLVEASGWGHTSEGGAVSQTLLCVDLPLLSDFECAKAHPQYTDAMACAGWQQGGADACQGDSGGPYVVTINGVRLLFGLTSFGNGCARPDAPGFIARLPGELGDEAAACAQDLVSASGGP